VAVDLYSEQDAETKVIVPELIRLGYDEASPARRVVLRFREPITVNQGRETRTIAADIVVHVHGEPLIVIDAKNPREYLTDNDREQVISYARLVGNVAPYSVLSNGIKWRFFDTISKQEIKGIPSYDDLVQDITRRRLSARQRDSLKDQATRTVFAIESARELSRLMRRCHDVIRNLRGYDPTKAFDELSKLLFAKMYEEKELAEGRRTENRFATDTVKRMRDNGVEIIQILWRDTITSERYREVFSDADAQSEIELPPTAIDQIVKILEDKSLGQTDLDVKGIAYEEFLASTFRGGGLGQYFTPREVVNFMVELVDPAIGEKIIDPACGTGGFLIRAYDVASNKIRNSELSAKDKNEQLQQLANSCLVGIDWESRAARTCKMNMIIHGDGHAGIYQAHALDTVDVDRKVRERQRIYPQAPGIGEGTFDIVLTNPPFGASDQRNDTFARYELMRNSQKRVVLFVERCLRLLKPGGRMAIVIPEGILSNKNDRYVRNLLRREAIIKAVIRLPQDAFKMSEGAACTSILFVAKKDPDDPALHEQGDIFYARAEYVGISPSGKPISQNDLLAIKEHYRRFAEGRWDGIEIRALGGERMEIVRAAPSDERGLWLEPTKNRTSLLYDRLSYVVRSPQIEDRFGYTYDHPGYHRIATALDAMSVEVSTLGELCLDGYPIRGKKPSEESIEGIPLIKVRNVTGRGISLETEYAPDDETTRRECARSLLLSNDVLITSTGEGTIGRVDVYPYNDPAIADNHVAICRLRPDVNLRYVVEFLRSEYGQIQILWRVSGSTGQTELLIDHVKAIQIPMPPSKLQDEIVRMMGEARERQDELRESIRDLAEESANVLAIARQEMMVTLLGETEMAI